MQSLSNTCQILTRLDVRVVRSAEHFGGRFCAALKQLFGVDRRVDFRPTVLASRDGARALLLTESVLLLLELLLAESVLLLLLRIKLAVVLLLSLVSKLLLTETRTLKVPVIRLSSVVGEILGRRCVLIKSLIRLIYGRTTETKPAAS